MCCSCRKYNRGYGRRIIQGKPSACETGKILGPFESLVLCILHKIHLYQYKLQPLHQLKSADNVAWESFARRILKKWNMNHSGYLTSYGQTKPTLHNMGMSICTIATFERHRIPVSTQESCFILFIYQLGVISLPLLSLVLSFLSSVA